MTCLNVTPLCSFNPNPSPVDQRSPFFYFELSIFDRKVFLKAPLAPKYTYFEGGARQKNAIFLVKNLQKVPQNACFWYVLSNICLRRRKFGQHRVFLVLWQSCENQFSRLKNFRFDRWKLAIYSVKRSTLLQENTYSKATYII